MGYVNRPDEVGSCTRGKRHHWHKSDRQPGPTVIRKWMVCCHCASTCEITGKAVPGKTCGRFNPNPEIIWPDINGEIAGASDQKKADEEQAKKDAAAAEKKKEEDAKAEEEKKKEAHADYLKERDKVTKPGAKKTVSVDKDGKPTKEAEETDGPIRGDSAMIDTKQEETAVIDTKSAGDKGDEKKKSDTKE